MSMFNPGFKGRSSNSDHNLPPGQSEVTSWPVLTYGPTQRIPTDKWSISIEGEVKNPITLNWDEFNKLTKNTLATDIHCVTRWSRFGMKWDGVSVDKLIEAAGGLTENAHHLIAESYGGYTTNLPIEDVIDNKAMVATHADGEPLSAEHGGPARLFVPHLYLWKSAKWVNKLTFTDRDHPGFWEVNGYHNYGDPWREQRYDSDE